MCAEGQLGSRCMTDEGSVRRGAATRQARKRSKTLAMSAMATFVLGLILVVVGILIEDLNLFLSLGGILVTLGVALFIFDQQGRQAAADQNEVREELGRLESVTTRLELHAQGHTEAL